MKRLPFCSAFNNERASSTVEFALVLPIMLLILMGTVEFGRIMSVSQMLNSAAREGARTATLPGANNSIVQDRVNEELASAGLPNGIIELTPSDITTANRNDPVTVRVTLPYTDIAWVPGFIPAFSGINLEGIVVMRKEGFV